MTFNETLNALKANWVRLAQFASFVLVAIPFLWPPPMAATDNGTAKNTATVIATVIIGLLIAAGMKWTGERDSTKWIVLIVVLLGVGMAAILKYNRLVHDLTCNYLGRRVVIGDRLTPRAGQHAGALQLTSCSQLLEEFAGKVEDVWTRESLARSNTQLTAFYVLTFCSFASMVVALMQLVLVFGGGTRKKAASGRESKHTTRPPS